MLHERSDGQSVAAVHPQAPPRHAAPCTFPVQSVHAIAPALPQELPAVPGAHVALLQQPPLQVVVALVHADPHVSVIRLQAVSVGQSVAALQPHLPPARQTSPAGLPTHWAFVVQETHMLATHA